MERRQESWAWERGGGRDPVTGLGVDLNLCNILTARLGELYRRHWQMLLLRNQERRGFQLIKIKASETNSAERASFKVPLTMSWLWCVEQHCDYYKWTLTYKAGLPVDPESLKVTYMDQSSTRVDDRCAFCCVRVRWIIRTELLHMRTVSELIFQLSVYHLNTFGMQRESSSPSSASDWSLTDINHGFLECLGMLENVRQWKVGQEFQASLLCQKHDHHKLTKFQQRRWKHLCVTDRFQQEEEWSGGALTKRNVNILSCSEDRNHQTAVGTYILYIHNVHTLPHVCSSPKTFLSWQRALSKVMF